MVWDIWHAFKNFVAAFIVLLSEVSKPLRRNFSIWHVLSLQGLLKLCFFYSISIVFIIIFNFRLPDNFDRNDTVIAVYTTERVGERMLSDRVVIAAKANGWKVIEACFSESLTTYFLTKNMYYVAASLVNLFYQPKFNLAVTHFFYLLPYGYNVVYLNVPNNILFNFFGNFYRSFKHLEEYDAYIDLHSVANSSNPTLMEELARLGKADAPIMPLYLAVNSKEYSPAKRENLLLIGSLWGCNRDSFRLKRPLKQLGNEGILVAYGLDDLGFLGDSYKGHIEDYGYAINSNNNIQTLMMLQKKYGIALALHNLEHMLEKMPTNRLSEAIMSGSIVISDHNGFAEKFFGDNLLYINSLAESDEIYKQIKRHIDWIRTNPEAAESKAKAAYDILIEKFALEKSLKKLMELVEKGRSR